MINLEIQKKPYGWYTVFLKITDNGQHKRYKSND